MAVNLKGRSFLTLMDFTPEEIRYMLDLGHDLKAKRRAGVCGNTLKGKHKMCIRDRDCTEHLRSVVRQAEAEDTASG